MSQVNLIHGDCLEKMGEIPSGIIDLILCDLPYGVTRNKWDSVIPFELLWPQYERIIKGNGAIILFGQGLFSAKLMLSNEKMYRYSLVWEKTTPTGHLNAGKMPLRSHEDIIVFYKSQPTYNPQKTFGHERKVATAKHKAGAKETSCYGKFGLVSYDSTERFPKSVWRFKSDRQRIAIHPTQKPVGLLAEIIKTYTNEGDTVLDNCMGSGSTGVACAILNRNFIGIEIDDAYFEAAKDRLNSPSLFDQ